MIDPTTVLRTVLPNGLRVLVRRDTSAPVVAIVTYVSAGYFDEPDEIVGIAHVLEHMYFKGTPARGVGEIARQTKAVGGYLNAATIYDHTSYYTVLPSSSLKHGLEIQFDAYANSTIDADELRRELEVIIQEAKRKEDNPPAVATETLYELLHDRHRIRRWRIGREEGLRALTRDALVGFYRNFYHPRNTVLTIVGDVDPAEVMREVSKLYGSLADGEPQRIPGEQEIGTPGFRYRELSSDIGQSQLVFGWRTPGTEHPDSPHLDLLATVLSGGRASRLYRAVRERQLASSVSAYDYTPTELGVFVVHAEARPDLVPGAARAIWAQLAAMRDGDIGELEIERAKRVYESRWIRRLEDMEGQANYLAEWEAAGDWRTGEQYLERFMAATRDDLVRVARAYLDPAQASVLVYRPNGTPVIAESAEGMRALLEETKPEPLAPTKPAPAAPTIHAPHAPALEREEAGVRIYRTANGVPVLVRQKPGALVHVGMFALGGASQEPEQHAGLTLLMARTAVKGTRTRTALQLAEESEMLGGSIGASVASDSFGWSISVPARHAAAAMELLADVVQHPSFPEDALATERTVAIADAVSIRDDMYRYPMRLATETAFAGHPYGVPASGTEKTLAGITVERVREWHALRALTAASVIAVVGDGDADELARLAAGAFTELRVADAPAIESAGWPSAVLERVEERDKAQTALALLFPAPGRRDDDRFAAAMISGVASGLGGRFFDELRDKQSLCYTVHAFASERRAAGTFGAYIATSPDKETVARDGLLGEFEKLRREPVSREELERAQTYAIGVHAIRQQSGGAVLGDVVDAWLFGELGELVSYDDSIRAVTAERMRRVAERYFDPARRVEGVVRGRVRA